MTLLKSRKCFSPTLKKLEDGFTLIELLIVVIFLGILSAIAIPNFVGQIGKARESETKGILGSIARQQQAYHWEFRTFASQNSLLFDNFDVNATSKYHNIPNPAIATSNLAKHFATAKDPQEDRVRNYALGIYYDTGRYSVALCESKDVGYVVDVGASASDPCSNDGTKLK